MEILIKVKRYKDDFEMFFKTGIVIMSLFAIVLSSVKYIPRVITVTNHNNAKKTPIHRVETKEKVLSLTFDINSKDSDLDKILEILDKYDLKATFFVTGKWVDDKPQELRKIAKKGHDIGNHGNNHKHMDLLGEKECKEEIIELHKKVKDITGIEMTLFRPPYGSYNNSLIHLAKELGYHTIKWDIDSKDWKDYIMLKSCKRVIMYLLIL